MRQRAALVGVLFCLLGALSARAVESVKRSEVSQFGITWQFDRLCRVGRFVTGDWWVVGPVTVVSVTPAPGPRQQDEVTDTSSNQFGDSALKLDDRMRNGSMVNPGDGSGQGYDSRPIDYSPGTSVKFPYVLKPGESLISSVSHTTMPHLNFMKEWSEKTNTTLRTAAVLTCLRQAPPADAFRPPYGGREKPIFLASNLRRNLLARLKPAGGMPDPAVVARYFERVWLEHHHGWVASLTAPSENMPCYGREFARLVSIGGLALHLDMDPRQKERILVGFVQLGIDLCALSRTGVRWNGGGGISSGRKWPILFAGIMLGSNEMVAETQKWWFHEDAQTYYGEGYRGQTVLWQMVRHHGLREPYEERPPESWDGMDKRSEAYRKCCNGLAWVGQALAARIMGAMELWGHDAFFDYCDRWMEEERRTFDPFVTSMWRAYRARCPLQRGALNSVKWTAAKQRKAVAVANPRPGGPIEGPSLDLMAVRRKAKAKKRAGASAAGGRKRGSKKAKPEALAEHDAKLLARVKEEVAAGRRVRFSVTAFQQRFEVLSADETGTLRLKSPVTEVDLGWSRFEITDRLGLARAVLREGEPEDHCLVAFYLIASGDEKGAEEHLAKGGGGAAGVEASFVVADGGTPAEGASPAEGTAEGTAAGAKEGVKEGAKPVERRDPPVRPVRKPALAEEEPALAKLYREAETAFIDGELDRAKELFEKIARDHPESAYAGKATQYLDMLE